MTRIMALISNKWVIDVIYTLSQGTFRYNQLRRILSGISHKMLSQTLDELEDHGLIQRVVYPVIPPKVEYSLTPLGVSLCELLAAFCQWTKETRASS